MSTPSIGKNLSGPLNLWSQPYLVTDRPDTNQITTSAIESNVGITTVQGVQKRTVICTNGQQTA
jgi:hypothetical protein